MELCDQLGCEPYIAVNLGSGTVQEAAEWIEYMTADGDSTIVKQRQANGRKSRGISNMSGSAMRTGAAAAA